MSIADDLSREEGMILILLNEAGPLSEPDVDKELVSKPTILPSQQQKALASLERKGLIILEEESEEYDITVTGNRVVEKELIGTQDFPQDSRL